MFFNFEAYVFKRLFGAIIGVYVNCLYCKHDLLTIYHHFTLFRHLSSKYIAMPFIIKVSASNIMIAPAALIINHCCGLLVQLKICIGSTVNSSKGVLATNGTYASSPITISGAVSPTALDSDRIMPVRIPPEAAGNTPDVIPSAIW